MNPYDLTYSYVIDEPEDSYSTSYTVGSSTSSGVQTSCGTVSGSIGIGNATTYVSVAGAGGGGGNLGGMFNYSNVTLPNIGGLDSTPYVNITNGDLQLMLGNGDKIRVGETIKMIMDRLCIIEPSFQLHEKYPALKEAYDSYKMIEAMCRAGDKEDEQ